jgi:hypothetical protein
VVAVETIPQTVAQFRDQMKGKKWVRMAHPM